MGKCILCITGYKTTNIHNNMQANDSMTKTIKLVYIYIYIYTN